MQAFTKKFNLQNCIYPFDIFYSLLPCLSFVTLFSFQGAIFRSLLKPDSKPRYLEILNLPSNLALLNPNVRLVGPSGLEPPTSRLSVVRSNQLSYGPTSRRRRGDGFLAFDLHPQKVAASPFVASERRGCVAQFHHKGINSANHLRERHPQTEVSLYRPPLRAETEQSCPGSELVEIIRFELMTPCLQSRCSPS